jgi:hypothetical protein
VKPAKTSSAGIEEEIRKALKSIDEADMTSSEMAGGMDD